MMTLLWKKMTKLFRSIWFSILVMILLLLQVMLLRSSRSAGFCTRTHLKTLISSNISHIIIRYDVLLLALHWKLRWLLADISLYSHFKHHLLLSELLLLLKDLLLLLLLLKLLHQYSLLFSRQFLLLLLTIPHVLLLLTGWAQNMRT